MSFKVEMSTAALEMLAEERKEDTREIFTPNDFYGHSTVLKQYCGLSQEYPIHGVLPHGPCITSKIWEIEKNHPFRARFLLSETQREVYRQQTDRDLYVIGSPLCYAARLIKDDLDELKEKAQGTVVFPAHSTHHVTAGFDHNSFIDRLKTIADSEQPVTVCLYWRDIQLGRHHQYLDAGFQCTTAGHMFDKDFVYRMLKIIVSHKQALTNRIGSSSLFAAAFGLPVKFTDHSVELTADNAQFQKEISPHDLPMADAFIKAGTHFNEQTITIQQKLAQEALGYEHIMTPEALKDVFESVESIQNGSPKYTFPNLSIDSSIPDLLENVKARMIAYPRYQRGTIGFQGVPIQFFDLTSFHNETQRIFAENTYEFKSNTDAPVIVDCGTNLGLLPIYYSQTYPKARIVAFEADPIKAQIAQDNFQAAKLTNTRLINKAVWIDEGTVPFECHTNIGEKATISVPTVRLSEFIGNQTIDLLRLNLGGAEFHVIKDSLAALTNVRHLVAEVHQLPGQTPHLADLLCLLRTLNFQCHLLEHWQDDADKTNQIKGVTLFAWREISDGVIEDSTTPSNRMAVNHLDGFIKQVPSWTSTENSKVLQPC